MTGLNIEVVGTPAPQGSKRHVGRGIMVESSKLVRPWREAVKHAALTALALGPEDEQGMAWREAFPFDRDPVRVVITFQMPRPRAHYGSDGITLRRTAPVFSASRPDVDKLVRSTFDALEDACVFRDSQVASVVAAKRYADGAPGAVIFIDRLTEAAA